MTAREWAELREKVEGIPHNEHMLGRQVYPTDPDEVCCLCHEDISSGTYVDDLQGWAHDGCAKEYFHSQTLSPDLKPSRTERLP